MLTFSITDSADQQFGSIIESRRVTIRLRWSVTSGRWSFDLAIDDLPVLHGRRVVTGIDLLAPFHFGIGALFALPTVAGAAPGRDELANGEVRLYQASREEIAAA